jgi:hypothetical protein
MKKLTKDMEKSLLNIYKHVPTNETNKSTLKALYDRKLISKDNKINSFGKRYAISKMPLQKQCNEISLPFEEIKLQYTGNPEPALLTHYQSLGYTGISCEGTGILNILKALMLDKLAEYNAFNEREDACTRYLEAQFTILEENIDEVILSISSVTKDQFVNNFNEIISTPFISSEYPELNIEFAIAMFDVIDKDTYINVARKIAEDPYTYRNGWPDLTLVKDKKVLFIEVKTTDKLHESQLITIPEMRNILPFEFSVCKITK